MIRQLKDRSTNSYEETVSSSALFQKAEEKEFSCIGINPREVEENRNGDVVVSISSNDFERFLSSTYGVSDIPYFNHNFRDEISLIRHTIEISGSREKCCDDDRDIITGKLL